ncbi:putative X8 domain-containing protein [Rosa chinensis]|uniref:Putative X8 domain-containing protein n=1 Tax=Rosa chinensis TaxID=74649 RepID=A0A2P6PMD2_ROSCH|nr:major pollen allergen Ole e 10 [Rosa chinensis]PRQ23092.1 putative X8 domain-containing protein [Rosa chinensis]
MASKFVALSVLLLQLAASTFSIHLPHYGGHPEKGIPGGPAGGIPGGPAGGIPAQQGGPAGGIPAPGAGVGGAQPGGNSGKKWCIGKKDITTRLLKDAIEELCKEVDCSPTGPQGLCYDESIWSRASFAMNLKYQKSGKKDSDCDFQGRAQITTSDPSWGKCVFISS